MRYNICIWFIIDIVDTSRVRSVGEACSVLFFCCGGGRDMLEGML
jgi:hypothetical protein